MNFQSIEKIANAVLYEGFLLYPYRKSAIKNQKQWHFGTLDADHPVMQTECLLESDGSASVIVKIRFLQGEIEREILIEDLKRCEFSFPPISGVVEFEQSGNRLTVRIERHSGEMLSTHTLLGVENGTFVSLLDPPEEYREAAAACRNIGTWPVLAGREGERSLMLSSPIILYDYPQIAPESAGDFFDGTEIDEMLTLRVLTLSDQEKQEVRAGSGRSILERTEMLSPEAIARMHGRVRGFREGDRVRLRPRKKADIFDIALDGKIAIVESVEQDLEGCVHIAVTVEDDPGREFGIARQIGHRFFFGVEEMELV